LEKEIDNIKPAGLSEVGSSITYIPLETTDQSLLKELKKVIIFDTYITVRDVYRVLMFDNSGIFIRQIGNRGQGPGEYSMSIMDHCFSTNGNNIVLLVDGQRCLMFDREGKYHNTYKLDSRNLAVIHFIQ